MTDTMFTRTALTEAAETAGVTTDQARTILEAAGVKVQPEKPALPTEPGSVIIATEVRGVTGEWRAFLEPDGTWATSELIDCYVWHRPNHITAWTEAVVLPGTELEAVRAAQGTLEELSKMGVTESDRGAVLEMAARLAVHGIDSDEVDRMVKQHYSTAQHAAPAEDMPDWDDVRNAVASQRGNGWSLHDPAINGITDAVIHLLHREEA